MLKLKNVATRSRITIGIRGMADAAGNVMGETTTFVVRALYGDVTQSGAVNILDQQAFKNALGKTVNSATFLLDRNLSGGINIVDQQAVKNELGTVLA